MQLIRRNVLGSRARGRRASALVHWALLGWWLLSSPAAGQSSFDATTTIFRESGGPLNMTVINPSVAANAQVVDAFSVQAGWEADVVSGASVAVVDAPGGGNEVDAITSATTLSDFRQVARGGMGLRGDTTRLDAFYSYGWENDYRSQTLGVRAAAELFERNTILDLTYNRGWDQVCDLLQPEAEKAVERQRMANSEGCFERGKGRTTRDLDTYGLQGGWTQNWTPIFNTQVLLSAQLLHGFQSNPYRAVWLGRRAAQEHHPDDRARYAVGLGSRLWLRPIGGALQLMARAYRDTWDVKSVSAELAYERNIGVYFRLRARGRYYRQTAAAFYSDDYALDPAGQYFTGDRELSAMSSWLVGGRFEFLPGGDRAEPMLGFIDSLRIVLKADFLRYEFPISTTVSLKSPTTRPSLERSASRAFSRRKRPGSETRTTCPLLL
ncbi:MAG: DUF3570 domain-containing protein [Myxococcales bacterium]